MATIEVVKSGNLGQINFGLAGALALINPLSLQLDGMLAYALGPMQADLAAQLQANVSATASISLSIGNPLDGLLKAIQAVVQLQAALTAAFALGIPPPSFQVTTQLTVLASANVSLRVKLGLLDAAIQAALRVKLSSLGVQGRLAGALGAGPLMVLAFDGISDLTPMQTIAGLLAAKLSAPVLDPANPGVVLQPTDPVSGVLIITSGSAAYTAMGAILPTT